MELLQGLARPVAKYPQKHASQIQAVRRSRLIHEFGKFPEHSSLKLQLAEKRSVIIFRLTLDQLIEPLHVNEPGDRNQMILMAEYVCRGPAARMNGKGQLSRSLSRP